MQEYKKWDAIVRSFAGYDVYYLSGYAKAFQLHGDGEPLLFYYEGEDVRGINVVMRRDIAQDPLFAGKMEENTYFDFTTPYGYGGWLIEGEGDAAHILTTYENWCRQHGIVSEFARFHPILRNHLLAGSCYEIALLGPTIALDLSSPEIIWQNLTSKNRNMIRKAQKSGIRVFNGRNPNMFNIFRELYNATMDKDNAADYYYFSSSFYDSVLDDLPHNAQVFYAQREDGAIIAASIFLTANGRLNYHLSGSSKEHQRLASNNLLLYEAALWGCANGCHTLHLGGGVGVREDGLYAFKKSFCRKEPCKYYTGKKVFIADRYDQLCRQCGDSPAKDFFPAYRA